MDGSIPKLLTVDDYEKAARCRLKDPAYVRGVYDYIAGGAGEEWTLRENRRAFGRWTIRPRVLVDVTETDISTTVLGQRVATPVILAPTSFQKLFHEEGEIATAKAARDVETIMVASTVSSTSLEQIATVGGQRWFQLYKLLDRHLTEELVRRAFTAGYTAIVLTVNAPLIGRRLRDERNDLAMPSDINLENLRGSGLPAEVRGGLDSLSLARHDPGLTWKDIAWLRKIAPLPLVLKGVMIAEDVERAIEAGVSAVILSNHGGRQLDGAPATLDELPAVVSAAANKIEIYMDGGIRTGADVFKALALGRERC